MTNTIRKFSTICVLAIWATPAFPESGLYFGGAVGMSNYTDSTADQDFSFSILAGYHFNKWFSVELGHNDFGEATFDRFANGQDLIIDLSSTSVGLLLSPSHKISNEPFLHIGYERGEAKTIQDPTGITSGQTIDDNNAFFGIGYRFELFQSQMKAQITSHDSNEIVRFLVGVDFGL